MTEFDYKCVPVPMKEITGKVGKDQLNLAVKSFEAIIKEEAKGGWELDQVDTLSLYQKPGFLGALFGKQEEIVNCKLLIFKKQIS